MDFTSEQELKQQARYEALEEETSESLAYFYCCISFDVPFDLNAIPKDNPSEKWLAYLDNLRLKKLDRDAEGNVFGFLDGLTDIIKIFGENLRRGEFSKAVDLEKSARNKKSGTKAQRKKWGPGSEDKEYTNADYKRMDEIFETLSSRLVSSGGYDTQQEYILRLCSRMSLDMEKCLAAGLVDKAQKLNKMIQENLASENLRKKDEKPVEDLRIDSIVDALEKAGMVKRGKILPLAELQKVLLERLGALGGKPSHKYPYTLDAADQMLLFVRNCMAANDGLPEWSDLPENMSFDENVAGEFADNPNAAELEAYEALDLVRHRGQGERAEKEKLEE